MHLQSFQWNFTTKEISKWAGLSRESLKNVIFEMTKFDDVLCRSVAYSKYIPRHTTFFFFLNKKILDPHGLMG